MRATIDAFFCFFVSLKEKQGVSLMEHANGDPVEIVLASLAKGFIGLHKMFHRFRMMVGLAPKLATEYVVAKNRAGISGFHRRRYVLVLKEMVDAGLVLLNGEKRFGLMMQQEHCSRRILDGDVGAHEREKGLDALFILESRRGHEQRRNRDNAPPLAHLVDASSQSVHR
ncbi:MAG: hypothetical protein L6Q71_05570, partial [Planctomycetes bacterium]|nr:hypothetical protein [Planctomycetota bacterium]